MTTSKVKESARGGKRYPKLNLEKTLKYTNRLITKTKKAPLPRLEVLTKVFDSKTWLGMQRLSSTKQYGLIGGNSKAFEASDLSKALKSAGKRELPSLLQEASLKPDVFGALHSKYQGQTVAITELEEYSTSLGVNALSSPECVKNFIDSLSFAGIAERVDGKRVSIGSKTAPAVATPQTKTSESAVEAPIPQTVESQSVAAAEVSAPAAETSVDADSQSNVFVNIDISSSMDPEKLDKMLHMLRQYGAL